MSDAKRTISVLSVLLISLLSFGLGPLMTGATGMLLPAAIAVVATGLSLRSDNKFLKVAAISWTALVGVLLVVSLLIAAGAQGVSTSGIG